MNIFAFDRDETVDVNGGPIPLGWVRWLARETHHEVWAVGNQLLVDEAGIPGVEEMERRTGQSHEELLVDVPPHIREQHRSNVKGKMQRLILLDRIYSVASAKIVIDDYDLAHVDGWEYLPPERFVERWGHYFAETR